ncbi:MAG: restriction endonuclease subunit S [Candidatus Competibacteraceae bacterium]
MRHPDLPSEWRIIPLSSVADIQTGLALGKEAKVDPVRVPYLRVANVQDGYLDLTEIKEVVIERSILPRYSLRPGDVLMTEGGDYDKLGRGFIWHGEIPNCLHQNHVFVVRPHTEMLSYFLAALTSSDYGRAYFQGCSKQSTNLASINSSQLKAFPVPLPPIWEQEAITSKLSIWDRGIRQLSDLIAAKLRFKQGLMQQLLTGRRRFKKFKEQWSEHQLGDLFKEREETNRTNLPLLSITADRGVVPRQEIERKDTSSENKSLYKRIAPGDIGYNTMRMWQGVSAMSSLEGIVSPAYTICIPRPAINAKFAAYLFKYPPVVHQFFRHSQGLVDDTLSLKFHHFAQIHVHVPSVEEQLRIVEVFQSADREIDLLRKKLDALKTQKKGLMQKLLTGQVRVKLPDPV